jgi:peptidoglycan-N-acetylglucosamine deacetylase
VNGSRTHHLCGAWLHFGRGVALIAAVVACVSASPIRAVAAPVVPALTLTAPIAVRANAWFTVSGTTTGGVLPGEIVTVRLQRLKSGAWSTQSTSTVAVGAMCAYSLRARGAARGSWRILATVETTSAHPAVALVQRRIKIVGAKVIALTFDDGPWRTQTDKILKTLKAYDVQATFFVLGSQVGGQAARVHRVADAGNVIGVHSWNHAIFPRLSTAAITRDLKRCKAAVLKATGRTPRWFRPPYGSTSARVKKAAKSLGLRQVIWSVDTLDWRFRTVSSVTSRALAGARNGSVVLMHDGGGNRSATAGALPGVIKKLRAKGFDFVTLDELVALGYSPH